MQDFSEWLAAQRPLPLRDTEVVLVVQDPCHLRHVQHAQGFVRTVLSPAYRLRDTDDDGLAAVPAVRTQCCNRASPVRSESARCTPSAAPRRGTCGAPVVVSANPGCAMHLGAAGLTVRHPAELLAAALEDHGA